MTRLFFMLAAVNGFLVVALGAFAAHGLERILTAGSLDVFKTGVQYHMFHISGLMAVGFLAQQQSNLKLLQYSGWLFLAGIVLFSGSLYLLAVTGITLLGIITPFGGVAFLLGWALLAASQLLKA